MVLQRGQIVAARVAGSDLAEHRTIPTGLFAYRIIEVIPSRSLVSFPFLTLKIAMPLIAPADLGTSFILTIIAIAGCFGRLSRRGCYGTQVNIAAHTYCCTCTIHSAPPPPSPPPLPLPAIRREVTARHCDLGAALVASRIHLFIHPIFPSYRSSLSLSLARARALSLSRSRSPFSLYLFPLFAAVDMRDAPERFFAAHRLLASRILGGYGIRFTVQFNLFAGSILGLGG